jgi:hypothetical protein
MDTISVIRNTVSELVPIPKKAHSSKLNLSPDEQLKLISIPKNENQISMFEMFGTTEKELDSILIHKELVKNKRKKRQRVRALYNLKQEDTTLRQIELSLLFEKMLSILKIPDDILDVPESWTDDDIAGIREYMIQRHLKFILDGRSGKAMAEEAWEWILSEDIHPFSFRVCLDSLAKNLGLSMGDTSCIDRDDVRATFYAMAFLKKVELNFCLIY